MWGCRVTRTGLFIHEKPEGSSYREAVCQCGEIREDLEPNERCWGFNGNNEALIETVEKTEYYCFKCGTQGIMVETGPGDYEVGPSYYCDACNSQFTMG